MKKVFVSSKLNGEKNQILNRKLENILQSHGFRVYLPQKELPPGQGCDSLTILERNEKAVDESDVVLVVFDDIDTGGAIEAERAHMRNKLVVGYRATNNHLGQMMEGYWKRLPEKYKAVSLDELSDTFKNLRKKLKLDLSIVIRCSDDERIKDCLDSIDASVDETVVVLNGASNKVKNIVGTYDVKKVEIEERNMSLAQNTGIESARNDKVLLVDSDCVLGKSAIHRLYSSLDNYAIIKGKVVFRSKGILSGIVSNIRNYHDSHEIKAYTPMLLIRKSIKESIGGYFFNRSIQWTDDDDFDKRVKEAGIRIKYVPNAVCYHDNENICSSLRGAFGYGKGLYNQIENSSQKFVVLDRIADTLRKSLSILQDYGIPTALYYTLFWKPIYFVGYYKEKTKKLMMRW